MPWLFPTARSVRPPGPWVRPDWWWASTGFLPSGCKRRRCGWCVRLSPFVMRERRRHSQGISNYVWQGFPASSEWLCLYKTIPQRQSTAAIASRTVAQLAEPGTVAIRSDQHQTSNRDDRVSESPSLLHRHVACAGFWNESLSTSGGRLRPFSRWAAPVFRRGVLA